VINRKPGAKNPEYLPGSQGGSLFRYRLKDGFLKRHIRVVLNSYGVSNVIFENFIKPGEDLWLIIPKHNHATVFLYEDGDLIKTQVFEAG
jgi:serine/threonine-protein kinase